MKSSSIQNNLTYANTDRIIISGILSIIFYFLFVMSQIYEIIFIRKLGVWIFIVVIFLFFSLRIVNFKQTSFNRIQLHRFSLKFVIAVLFILTFILLINLLPTIYIHVPFVVRNFLPSKMPYNQIIFFLNSLIFSLAWFYLYKYTVSDSIKYQKKFLLISILWIIISVTLLTIYYIPNLKNSNLHALGNKDFNSFIEVFFGSFFLSVSILFYAYFFILFLHRQKHNKLIINWDEHCILTEQLKNLNMKVKYSIILGFFGAIIGIPLSYFFQPEMVREKVGGIAGYINHFNEILDNKDLASNVLISVVIFAILGLIIGFILDNINKPK